MWSVPFADSLQFFVLLVFPFGVLLFKILSFSFKPPDCNISEAQRIFLYDRLNFSTAEVLAL